MAHGLAEGLIGYTGTDAAVAAAVADGAAQIRQRILIASYLQERLPDRQVPWWEASYVNDAGEKVIVSRGHYNPEAPDADAWGMVDGRLPHEPEGV